MKKQAIKIIDEMINDSQKSIDNDPLSPRWLELSEISIAILNQAKSRIESLWDGWIPVTERLPEKDWMFYWYFWIVDKLHYSVSQNRWIDEIWEPKNPTHYMEIHYPLPPK